MAATMVTTADPDSLLRSPMADPYPDARNQVRKGVEDLREMHDEWKRLLRSGNSTISDRFQHLHSEIAGELQGLSEDLDGIEHSIKVVETNRRNFAVDDAEMSRRRDFLRTTRATLKDVKDNVQSQATKAKIEADRKEAELARNRMEASKAAQQQAAAQAEANQGFLNSQRLEQQHMERHMDESLFALGKSAARMKETAHEINKEIVLHNNMLDDLDREVEEETEKLNVVMKHMGRLLKTSDRSQLCVIISLVALFIVLLFLVVN